MFISKLALKAKTEAPAPHKTEAKWMPWKPRRQCWQGPQPQKEADLHITTFQPNTPQREHTIIKFPQSLSQTIRRLKTYYVHCGCQGQLAQIKQAMKKVCDSDVAKVSTLIKPNGEKKVYVQLAPDYDALGVANKIGII
jgi:large subunit ribosomal protein L23Ae